MWWLIGLACTSPQDSDELVIGEYSVSASSNPTPMIAGETSEITLIVRGPDGTAVPDLQQSHERMIHTFVISRDLTSFQHPHHEDFYELTATDLQHSTFHFPLTVPLAGDYLFAFNYAHHNEYLRSSAWMTADGQPEMAVVPVLIPSLLSVAEEVTAELQLDVGPIAGSEAAFHVRLSENGELVTDVVQYLGADAHLAVASADLNTVGHSHAWFPGMEDMPPSHAMPHSYDGPDIPFHYVFPFAGSYKLWVELTREGRTSPLVFSFVIEVPEA